MEAGHGDQTAIIWEGNNPEEDQAFTYSELLAEVQKFANVLKSFDVKKGDRVCLYMQMIPQLPVAMLTGDLSHLKLRSWAYHIFVVAHDHGCALHHGSPCFYRQPK